MKNNLEIILKNELSEISRVNEIIEDFCNKKGLDNKFAFALNLALDELVTNIISYGFRDENEHEIRITLSLDRNKEKIILQIEDSGVYFNPLDQTGPDHLDKSVEEKPIGGLGIHIVKKFTDNIHYSRQENKNILTLTKNINN